MEKEERTEELGRTEKIEIENAKEFQSLKAHEKKGGNIGFTIFLILVILGLVGYICYDKGAFDKLLEKYNIIEKDEPKTEEELVLENKFDLSSINCEGTDTCEKEVKLSYNNANHTIKLVKKSKDTTKYAIEVYNDSSLIDTLDGGEFYDSEGNDKVSDLIKSLDGYIYVIDSKYFAIVYPKNNVKTTWFLKLYNDTKPYQMDNDIRVTQSGGAIKVDDIDLTSLSSVDFDGHTIKYWAQYCGNEITPISSKYLVAQQHALVFDGNAINDTVIKTARNAIGGGQFTCDDE